MDLSDVVVLGGGPGGYACALRLADLGMNVVLVEADKVGGTCLHRGCVPTRAMLHGASFADAVGAPARRWGIRATLDGIDMGTLVATRDQVVGRNHRAVERHLARAGVTVLRGKGWLRDRRTVLVEGRELQARRAVVLATGSSPRTLPELPVDGRRILTSDQAMRLEHVPSSVIVIGGGAIGAEFSQIWSALGSDVTLVEVRPHLVPMEDPDVGRELARALKRRGIAVHVGARPTEAIATADGVEVTIEGGGTSTQLTAELVLLAVGRDPSSENLGFAESGVLLEDGFVVPADWSTLETHAPGVYAVGDLLPLPSHARAHVAYAEGMLVADAIAGHRTSGIDYVGVPRVTHGLTETACVGLSEPVAREVAGDIEVLSMSLGGVAKGAIFGEPGLAKVVAERGGNLLGVHLVGPHVTEIIGEATALVDFEADPSEAASLVHPHPTLSELLAEMHLSLAGRPLHYR